MINFITSYKDWLEEYKKDKYKTWIRAILSNDLEIYLIDYSDWFELKTYCKEKKLSVKKVGLQYRSHSIEVDTLDSDGVYLTRSIIGSFGQSTRQTFTIGMLHNDIVKKTIWVIPELIKELEDEDNIADCFEEALIYDYTEKREA
jgi:hypothetical protein